MKQLYFPAILGTYTVNTDANTGATLKEPVTCTSVGIQNINGFATAQEAANFLRGKVPVVNQTFVVLSIDSVIQLPDIAIAPFKAA